MADVDQVLPVHKTKTAPPVFKVNANVLLIEDDLDSCEALSLYLRREGFGVRAVGSRDEAIHALDTFLYDFIVMDLSMPGMSAAEFVRAAHERSPRSKVILMTALERVERQAHLLGLGDFIGKPFDPDRLLELLKPKS